MLDRALSKLGLASRTEARALIAAGRVLVNGRVCSNPSAHVIPEKIGIEIDGEPKVRAGRVVLMLHKPRGIVTTRSDPEGRATVYDLLADVPTRALAVGRLDFATSGLLLFTNDTRLADWLTDPKSGIERVYLVTVRGKVEGMADDRVVVRKTSARESHLVITLTSGKNREIRELVADAGYSVTRLRRVQFGGLQIGRLAPGAWRLIDEAELAAAFPGLPAVLSAGALAKAEALTKAGAPQSNRRVPSPK